MIAKLPGAAIEREPQKVPLTKETEKFKWTQTLSYHEKAKQWCGGEIQFGRKRYEIEADASKKIDPESRVDELLSRILAKLADATTEATYQLTELYNASWVQGRELKPTGIKRRIKIGNSSIRHFFIDVGASASTVITRMCPPNSPMNCL